MDAMGSKYSKKKRDSRKGRIKDMDAQETYGDETSVEKSIGLLEIKLLNVPLPKRKVARRAFPLSCGYPSVDTLFAER